MHRPCGLAMSKGADAAVYVGELPPQPVAIDPDRPGGELELHAGDRPQCATRLACHARRRQSGHSGRRLRTGDLDTLAGGPDPAART